MTWNLNLDNIPTVASIAEGLIQEWKERPASGVDFDSWLGYVVPESVPVMTTDLFAMVIKDNGLAFADGPRPMTEPFACLHAVICDQVDTKVRKEVEG